MYVAHFFLFLVEWLWYRVPLCDLLRVLFFYWLLVI